MNQNGGPQFKEMEQIQKKGNDEVSIHLTRWLALLSVLLRVGFFLFGLFQDATMDVKYTDIDYLVFSDAASYVQQGRSPYLRETYRYTPLLAWMLIPNSWGGLLYSFGKVLFMICDLMTGILIYKILELSKISEKKRLVLASIWLINPMVITISSRGSSESVLTVFVMLFVYFLLKQQIILSAIFSGLSVHFKIYPIIYIPTAILFISKYSSLKSNSLASKFLNLINFRTIKFAVVSFSTFLLLGLLMHKVYGYEFLYHSYLYHLTRIDHRHNFSIYNTSLYLNSALTNTFSGSIFDIDFTKLAFIPQLLISGVLIPIVFTNKSFIDTLFLQTFSFVTLNKVMTSQYFIWFLILLPIYLRNSSLLSTRKLKGIICLLLWIISQASWLFFAYNLEFQGQSTFYPGLLLSSSFFFISNVFILGVFMDDINNKAYDNI